MKRSPRAFKEESLGGDGFTGEQIHQIRRLRPVKLSDILKLSPIPTLLNSLHDEIYLRYIDSKCSMLFTCHIYQL